MGLQDTQANLLVCIAVVLAFALSTLQAFIGAKVGSDHPVHVFITRGIRDNGYRLFVRIPNLLNTCYCAAMPLYMHWIVAHFRAGAVFWLERLLNPIVNTLHVTLFATVVAVAAEQAGLPPLFVGLATAIFALTPQFFHALSARNFGLSSRGTGLLLLTLFFLASHVLESEGRPLYAWAALVLAAWLIWGFSTFAQQALCILSTLLLLLTGRPAALLGTTLGLLLFIALHPRYSLSYLLNTLRFIRTYASELAPIYILSRRHSIWRDLVRDIWLRLAKERKSGAHYAYENSAVIVLLLNPLVVVACLSALNGLSSTQGLLGYSQAMALVGLCAVILTSFRLTRFLGEPERYAEVVTPWAALAGSHAIYTLGGTGALVAMVLLFLTSDLLQLFASNLLLKHVAGTDVNLQNVQRAVSASVDGEVRFCCNNEHFTKRLMQNDWHFAYYLAVGQDYCGMKATEIFSTFPFLRREACERVVATYRVNACLLDRNLYETIFDEAPRTLRGMRLTWETERFRLFALDWAPEATALAATARRS